MLTAKQGHRHHPNMRIRLLLCFGVLVSLWGLVEGCTPNPPAPTPTPAPMVTLRWAVAPRLTEVAQALAGAYRARNQHVQFTFHPVVNRSPAIAVQDHQADLALIAAIPTEITLQDLSVTPISQRPLAVVVHPQNPMTNLSITQLRDIYTGRISFWQDLVGGGLSGEILVVTQAPGSVEWRAFNQLVMSGARITPRARVLLEDNSVLRLVAQEPLAIGYASAPSADAPVNTVRLDNVPPTAAMVRLGRYPLAYTLALVARADAPAYVNDLVDFALSPSGQELLARVLNPAP